MVEANYVAGDTIFFSFVDDSLSYVRIVGNSEGTYRYVDLKRNQTTDSLRTLADSTLTYVPFKENAETVDYSAKRIEYWASTGDLYLDQSAAVKYQDRVLRGKEITYFSQLKLMDARGEPELVDGGETFYGEHMNYDLEEGTGLVNKGTTQFGEGFYSGENVAKVGDNEMKVWQSRYTTCDRADPHFHFRAIPMMSIRFTSSSL